MNTNTAIKTWEARATEAGDFPAFSAENFPQYMKAEIAELRAALDAAQPAAQQGDDELPPLPEMEGLQDILHALQTPEDWDEDYRSTWQKLQVAERNKMQWRGYALLLRAALAQRAISDAKPVEFYRHRPDQNWIEATAEHIEHLKSNGFASGFEFRTLYTAPQPAVQGQPDSGRDAALPKGLAFWGYSDEDEVQGETLEEFAKYSKMVIGDEFDVTECWARDRRFKIVSGGPTVADPYAPFVFNAVDGLSDLAAQPVKPSTPTAGGAK